MCHGERFEGAAQGTPLNGDLRHGETQADIERAIINKGRQLGMNNYLAKPFQNEQLKNAIEAIVGRL